MRKLKKMKWIAAAVCLIFLFSFMPGSIVMGQEKIEIKFQDELSGWSSEGQAGEIVQDNGENVLRVGDGDFCPEMEDWVNYTVALKAKIDFQNGSYPGIYIRSSENGRYRIYFDAAAGTLELERQTNGISIPLSRSAVALQENSQKWTDLEISIKNKEIKVSFAGEQVLEVEDALPLASGGVGFTSGGTDFFLSSLVITSLSGSVDISDEQEEVQQTQEEIPGEIIYEWDFENGKGSWNSFGNKSTVESDGDNHIYHVQSYDYEEKSLGWGDFSAEFDIKIEYGAQGTTWPAIYLKWAASGARYDVYFDSNGQAICVEYVQGGQKRWVGAGNTPFLANDGEWVHMKAVCKGGNIKIYYEDMQTPVVDVTDETPIEIGGIGFGDGGAQVFVDNIEVRDLPMEVILPDFNAQENQTDYANSAYVKEIQRLIGLNLIQGDENGNISPSADLTRAEFAQVLFRARNLTPIAASEYSDVPESHWANGVIGAVSSCGLMNGYVDHLFRPDEEVSVDEAAKALVCLLGYEALAEEEGGYPAGYRKIASRKNILQGIESFGDQTLTREEAAKMLSNAIDEDILYLQSYSASETVYGEERGKTVLSEYHNIYKDRGLVSETDSGSLTGTSELADGMIRIDETIYQVGSSDAQEYLGYQVSYYYQDNKNAQIPVLLYAEPFGSETPLKVDAENIALSDQLETFSYYDENGRLRSVPLSKNLTILLNGAAAEYKAENLCPEIGSVTLLKTGGSSSYDLALTESWETWVIGNISRDTGMIRDFYRDRTLSLEPENPENSIQITKDGIEATMEDLNVRDVLLVKKTERADSADYEIRASSAKFQGNIEAIRKEEDGTQTIQSRETKYRTSPYYRSLCEDKLIKEVTGGALAMFYFDAMGNVAVIEAKGNDHIVLLNAVAPGEGFSGLWQAEVLEPDGTWTILDFPREIQFNGVAYSVEENGMPAEFYQEGEFVKQLVYLKKNSHDEILSLDTAQQDQNAVLRIGSQYASGIRYTAATGSFDSQSYIDGNTQVFAVPAEEWDRKQYTAAKQAYFQDDRVYAVQCYNENEFEVAEAVLVFEGKTGAVSEKLARPFVVDSIAKALDGDEEVWQISGYQEGALRQENTFEEDAVKDLEKGDVILMRRDLNGNIVGYTYLLDRSKGRQYSNNPVVSMAADRIVVEGDVLKYSAGEGRILLCIGKDGEGNDVNKAYMLSGAPAIMLYDKNADRIFTGSLADIQPGTHILLEFSWNTLRDIVLYPDL
ncbi:S-layer homology domain-containing protein [Ructibacterium gallinarum]|uniref:S-layer homology domain-containing protein n=1 Tax=Ructibacterium gallinarum TaxID=2779355 RepID=A0A9D5M333_9FIRM|nr:S-layer homology domain-containing protein [Ructibacterium gallinarum]MBE5040628.1 S-layer homology domain-containing protein [Ructibacterium gallinarum]